MISTESIGVYAGGFYDLDFCWAPYSVALICFTSGVLHSFRDAFLHVLRMLMLCNFYFVGTTANPKGVAISHDALIVQSKEKIAIIGYNHNEVINLLNIYT